MMKNGDEECTLCRHARGPHALIATNGTPLFGGIMLCPTQGCMCFSTWGTLVRPNAEDVRVPPADQIETLRAMVQGGAEQ